MVDLYPHYPGSRGVDTSDAAAADIAPGIGRLQRLVLASVRQSGPRGLTTNEIAELLDIDRGSIQPRTSELKALGLILDSGNRRQNQNMKKAIVWIAKAVANG